MPQYTYEDFKGITAIRRRREREILVKTCELPNVINDLIMSYLTFEICRYDDDAGAPIEILRNAYLGKFELHEFNNCLMLTRTHKFLLHNMRCKKCSVVGPHIEVTFGFEHRELTSRDLLKFTWTAESILECMETFNLTDISEQMFQWLKLHVCANDDDFVNTIIRELITNFLESKSWGRHEIELSTINWAALLQNPAHMHLLD